MGIVIGFIHTLCFRLDLYNPLIFMVPFVSNLGLMLILADSDNIVFFAFKNGLLAFLFLLIISKNKPTNANNIPVLNKIKNERKMKVVFFHDHRFKKYNNKHYSEGQFSDSTWQRYLDFSDELLVVAREVEYTGINTEKLNAINNQRVLFDCFDEIKLFDRVINCQLKTNIAKKIEYTDVVVCRLPSFLGSLAFDVAFDLKKKIIVEVVGCPYDSLMNHGSFIAKLLAPLEAYKMKRIIKVKIRFM